MNGSSGNLAVPVIAGFAAGMGLIVLFSISLRPSSDDEIRTKVRNLPEVQAFYERYAPLEQITHDGTSTYVDYSIERSWYREHGAEPLRGEWYASTMGITAIIGMGAVAAVASFFAYRKAVRK